MGLAHAVRLSQPEPPPLPPLAARALPAIGWSFPGLSRPIAFAPRVRRGLLAVAALAAGGFAGTAAPAQIAPGVSGSSSTTTMDDGEAWRTLRAFGSCYASRNLDDALALIATPPGSRAEAETYRRLFRRDNQCVGDNTDLRMPVVMVRGAIAEGLYKNGAALPASLACPPASGAPIRKRARPRAAMQRPIATRSSLVENTRRQRQDSPR